MNLIEVMHTDYIRYANRSVDCIKLMNHAGAVGYVWVYNYQGLHFCVFDTYVKVTAFLNTCTNACLCDFDGEAALDQFLLTYNINP
jgi:hypothetical protein